ncbi:MAG: LON peptidase substrate-binding domain-containing protein [Deltaproteobacteria bacterium]|nr:LON peptidase substrate-binding domain-containing protein [Deltaproteobacteria bacterium]
MAEVELPTILPVFPLPNVVLFPDAMLPLHIFEPRYRQMIRDTQDKTPPLIGMALLRGNWQEHYEGQPEIFPVCCAGELVRVAPLADGRFNLLLRGVREYRIKEEIQEPGKLYRQFVVEWRELDRQPLASALRQELNQLLEAYLQKNETVQKFLSDPTVGDEFFVNFFAFHLDLLPLEKQSLLDAPSLPERAALLRDTLDFKLTEGRWADGGSPSGKPRLH